MRSLKNREWVSASRWLVLLGGVVALVACGGGDEDSAATVVPGPSVVAVDAPPPLPAAGASGTHVAGTLDFLVFSATGTPANATATTTIGGYRDITFAAAGPFAGASAGAPGGGLVISKDLANPTYGLKWNTVTENGGIVNLSFPSGSGGGLLSQGNFFVYCSAGRPTTVTDAVAKAGAQVAVSGNFVAMTNIASLYGQTFNRFDCTQTAPTTKFGDRKGQLTMVFDGLTLTQAAVVAAFSSAGYQPTPGSNPTYKRRAYQITLNGQTQYAIVALDVDAAGNASASVLYQYN